MKIFDSHAHYDDSRFETEYEGGRQAALSHVFSHQVSRIVNVGANIPTSAESIALARQYEDIFAAVGIHPCDCGKSGTLKDEMAEIKRLAEEKKVVALGETGLDYHYTRENEQQQHAYFHAHLTLAEEIDLPVIVHDREAHGDSLSIVKAHPTVKGVFHSFSGSKEMAEELLRLGWIVSFSGVVTFKNAARMQEVVANVPLDKMMVETDCPYLTPHPHRGELNHSDYLTYTIEKIAQLKGESPERVAEVTYENACRFYRLKP
ncbi:MAG: TatD family hydrolase [Clostridiales bacterium]|nr:TatD family hydrolase [Clostridiales bacterium]